MVAKVNKALDDVRAAEARRMKADGYEPVLKQSRWCLLKRPENLTANQALGGHPKSGHRGSLQNRPTDRGQDLTLLYRVGGRRGKKFFICVDLCGRALAFRLYWLRLGGG
jgi:hypothetical protein